MGDIAADTVGMGFCEQDRSAARGFHQVVAVSTKRKT